MDIILGLFNRFGRDFIIVNQVFIDVFTYYSTHFLVIRMWIKNGIPIKSGFKRHVEGIFIAFVQITAGYIFIETQIAHAFDRSKELVHRSLNRIDRRAILEIE